MSTDPTVDLRPSVEDVAQLLRARTQDSEGREVGTFNVDTRPTAEEVEGHIDSAMGLVGLRLPAPAAIPDAYHAAVSTLVAYRAAMRIEKSYFPEQVNTPRSPYEQLREEYLDDLQALVDALAAGSDPDDAGFGAAGHRAHSEYTPTFLRAYGEGYGYPWWPGPYPPGYDHWPEPENPANWASPLQPPRNPPQPGDLPVGDQPASALGDPRPWPWP